MTSRSVDSEDNLRQVTKNDLLVRTILANLSAKQLANVTSVCHLWFDIGSNILRNRVYFETFLLIYEPKGFRLSGGGEPIGGDGDGKDKKLFLNNLIKSEKVYKCDREDSTILQLERYFTEKLSTLPALCILFTSSVTLARKLAMKKILPTNCQQLILCSKAGIVGQPSLYSKPIELEKYHFKLNAISGSFVGRQWGNFKIILTNWKDEESAEPSPNDVDYPVKCTIIFSINFEDVKRFNSWLNSSENPIPIGGALVDRIIYKGEEVNMLTVSFAGKNVKAASFVMDSKKISEAETKLIRFKSCLDFDVDDTSGNVKTIGFLFICAGRGAEFYQGNLNVESNLIHRIFPHIVFSGVFGNGEYGWNCYNYPNCDQQFKSLSQSNLALSYTTAIVLVQFNRR